MAKRFSQQKLQTMEIEFLFLFCFFSIESITFAGIQRAASIPFSLLDFGVFMRKQLVCVQRLKQLPKMQSLAATPILHARHFCLYFSKGVSISKTCANVSEPLQRICRELPLEVFAKVPREEGRLAEDL